MKFFNKEKGSSEIIVIAVLALVLLIGGGWYVWNANHKSYATTKTIKHPGIVVSEVFSTNLDPTGAAATPATNFSPTNANIYVVLGLNGAKASQRVEYVRYLNGKFIDNGSIPIKDSAKFAAFAFGLKPGKTHPVGIYTVKIYTNGIFERLATYKVQ